MNSLLKVIQLYKNEDKLIKNALKNDREAQHMLYTMFSSKMLSVCRYYISDLQHAEDVMLEGFLKVFDNLRNFKNQGSFEGWVRRIMVRESISFLRRQKNIEFSLEDADFEYKYSSDLSTELEVSDIQKLIDSLPEGYKMVFVMYAIEGYKHNEIADILNISVGTSKSQLFKARKMLQQKINEINKTSYGTN